MITKYISLYIGFFYPPFRKLMPFHTFRYAACGGANVVLDISLFFIINDFILKKQVLHLGFIAFKPHIAAFLLSFLVTFPIGFLLSKYIVWTDSTLRGRVQLSRYFIVVVTNLILNYLFIKLFVEYFMIYPTLAKLITTIIVVAFSYISQKHFTFKVNKSSVSK